MQVLSCDEMSLVVFGILILINATQYACTYVSYRKLKNSGPAFGSELTDDERLEQQPKHTKQHDQYIFSLQVHDAAAHDAHVDREGS